MQRTRSCNSKSGEVLEQHDDDFIPVLRYLFGKFTFIDTYALLLVAKFAF